MDIAHLHFLVAEGEPATRKSICEVLGQLGASQITEVSDGHTALRDRFRYDRASMCITG